MLTRPVPSPSVHLRTPRFEDLALGMQASLSRVVQARDLAEDLGPDGEGPSLAFDEAYLARTRWGQRMGHGLYTAGLVAVVLGTRLPGPGAVFLSQSVQFLGPVQAGETVVASVEVVELVAARQRARLFCDCLAEGRTVLEGEAWIAVPGEG